MSYPEDLLYTKDHEWARLEGKNAAIGITAFAVEQLGDITLVDLPPVGTAVTAGESFGTVESVKSVSDLYAPVTGTVSKVNTELVDHPELVNDDPYGEGWLIEITYAAAPTDLLSAQAYAEMIAETE